MPTLSADFANNPPATFAKAFDIDGDGDLDLMVNSGYSTFTLRNDGGLVFTQASGLLSSEHNSPSALAELGDFNGDGFVDCFFFAQNQAYSERFSDGGAYVEVPAHPLLLHSSFSLPPSTSPFHVSLPRLTSTSYF